MTDISPIIIYSTIIVILGVFTIWWFRHLLVKIEKKQKEDISKVKEFLPITTESPLKHPTKSARKVAFESLAAQFTIFKRAILIFLVVIWSALLILPLLGKAPSTIISLAITVIAIILGIAARPYLENFFAGVVLSVSKNLNRGDTLLIEDHYGTVEDISTTHTIVKLWNWQRYIIPNSRMLSKEFINLDIKDSYQWAYVEFWVDYKADLAKVEQVARKIASTNKYFADYEPPEFWVMEMTQYSVKCWIAAWANSPSDAWLLKTGIRNDLIRELQSLGIKTHTHEIQYDKEILKSKNPGQQCNDSDKKSY